jgi:hypothetical protein
MYDDHEWVISTDVMVVAIECVLVVVLGVSGW